ncbi:MAG: hypothetical protein FWB73_03115 [Treponema sp.]|nr:hypothetical protein [Treponema sp.]
MLKSELVISENLRNLNVLIYYLIDRFYNRQVVDLCNYIPLEFNNINYKEFFKLKYRDIFFSKTKDKLIPILLDDLEYFKELKEIIRKIYQSDIDVANLKKIYDIINETILYIRQFFIKTTKTYIKAIFRNYQYLLRYFYPLVIKIQARREYYELFNNNDTFLLRFNNTEETSFSIKQQKMIIDFIEKVLSALLPEYLDIIAVEFDTGSPKLNCSININVNINIKLDINKIFSNLFNFISEDKKADIIKSSKKIGELINKSQKEDTKRINVKKSEISQDEFQKQVAEICVSYSELRKHNIAVAIDNSNVIKQIEGNQSLAIEGPDSSSSDTE